MNRGLNLPQIQRIMHEFEKESATMDMKEEMMSDAVDDVMDDELEDEETEGDQILKQVLDEIGVDLSQQVSRVVGLCTSNVTYRLHSSRMRPMVYPSRHLSLSHGRRSLSAMQAPHILRVAQVEAAVVQAETLMKMHYKPDWMRCAEVDTHISGP